MARGFKKAPAVDALKTKAPATEEKKVKELKPQNAVDAPPSGAVMIVDEKPYNRDIPEDAAENTPRDFTMESSYSKQLSSRTASAAYRESEQS